MNADLPANNPEHRYEARVVTTDLHSVHLFEDVVGDTTVRPLRPELRALIRPRPELWLRTLPPEKSAES
jgi:hypothetical protein